jgi:hypothetical protein
MKKSQGNADWAWKKLYYWISPRFAFMPPYCTLQYVTIHCKILHSHEEVAGFHCVFRQPAGSYDQMTKNPKSGSKSCHFGEGRTCAATCPPFEFIEIRQNCERLSWLFAFEGRSAPLTKPNSGIIQNRPFHRQVADASHASQKVPRINNQQCTLNNQQRSLINQQSTMNTEQSTINNEHWTINDE